MCNFTNYRLKKLSPVWLVMLAVYFLAVSAFSGSALAQGTDLRLNNDSANQGLPAASVAYSSATKEYLVIWRDDRGGYSEVYGQRVNQANVLVGNNIKITGGRNGISSAITYVGSTNQYLVVYEVIYNGGGGYHLARVICGCSE